MLWIDNDEGFYNAKCSFLDEYEGSYPYKDFIEYMGLEKENTPDGIAWLSNKLDYAELDGAFEED